MARPPADPELCIEAWEMRVNGRTLRHIAKALGCCPETARSWIARGADLMHSTLTQTAERSRALARIDRAVELIQDELDQGTATDPAARSALRKDLLAATRLHMELLGLKIPVAQRVHVTDDRPEPGIDPETAATIAAAVAQATHERNNR